MRWLTVLLFSAAIISAFVVVKNVRHDANGFSKNSAHDLDLPVTDMRNYISMRLKPYTDNVKVYAARHALNSRYCFLVDMKIASGSKRFFIYDLKNDSILKSGLVTNGSGINNISDTVVFSNEPGSNCTSLGRYKIGNSYYGKFGLAWKLYGLDKSNSNAFERFVVLHSHPCVPHQEIVGSRICESWGCPTVSPVFLSEIKTYLDPSTAPVLLWIFK